MIRILWKDCNNMRSYSIHRNPQPEINMVPYMLGHLLRHNIVHFIKHVLELMFLHEIILS